MPELTVSMPAYNTGKYIREAIDSVLNQEGIDLELFVIDDGSNDNTAEIVSSYNDNRLKLIQNKNNMGIGFCHNLVIDNSASPFIAHVDSDDIVMQGALRRMIDELKISPNAGQAHCYFLYIDEEGNTTRKSFYSIREHLINYRKPGIDYKWHLLVHGCVINHLRTYRREVFEVVGKFNEKIKYGADFEMGVKIIDKYEIKLVPEFLYCLRSHSSSITGSLLLASMTFWLERFLSCRELIKNKEITFTNNKKYNFYRLMLLGMCYIFKLDIFLNRIKKILSNSKNFFFKHLPENTSKKLYSIIIEHIDWWPLDIIKYKSNPKDSTSRVAYYLWQFPVSSQTFIRRELNALIQSGLVVDVIADELGDIILDSYDSAFIKKIDYLYPINEINMSRYKTYFFRKNPLRYINLLLYVICHRYGSYKSYYEDKSLFEKAVYLAGILKDKNISHIHAPWSDRMAFIALISSRLLGIKYTVQARAHDIHRVTHKFALKEKFNNADVVITNTKYNERHIKSMLSISNTSKVHTIYEGINLNQFRPEQKNGDLSKSIRILSVARLIEEKGLIYLLKACKILKDKGVPFKCEIIGGSEEPLYKSYLVYLKKLHMQLGLEKDVFFLGNQPFKNVIKKYKESDIFVLPCVVAENGGRDTSPNSLIEAMAMKLPVITTSISGLSEIVDNEINGIVIPPKDVVALHDAMTRLINDTELRKQFGENARKKVINRFDINRNINRYRELFLS